MAAGPWGHCLPCSPGAPAAPRHPCGAPGRGDALIVLWGCVFAPCSERWGEGSKAGLREGAMGCFLLIFSEKVGSRRWMLWSLVALLWHEFRQALLHSALACSLFPLWGQLFCLLSVALGLHQVLYVQTQFYQHHLTLPNPVSTERQCGDGGRREMWGLEQGMLPHAPNPGGFSGKGWPWGIISPPRSRAGKGRLCPSASSHRSGSHLCPSRPLQAAGRGGSRSFAAAQSTWVTAPKPRKSKRR